LKDLFGGRVCGDSARRPVFTLRNVQEGAFRVHDQGKIFGVLNDVLTNANLHLMVTSRPTSTKLPPPFDQVQMLEIFA